MMSSSFSKPNSLVGSPVERIEDLRFLRGRGQYVDDIVRDGLLHAAILRSSVAHGRIRSVDATAALARTGVRAVITAADVLAALGTAPAIPLRQEQMPAFKPYEQPVIAHGKVRYVGEPIALVVADSAAIAEDALEVVALDIEALPAAVGPGADDALLVDGTTTNCAATLTALRGDADAAFKDAPYVRRERFRVQRHTAVPMEARGLLAEWDASRGHLTVYGAAKVAFTVRRILAAQLSLPEDAITMIEGDVGGAFGVRGEFYPEDFLIPFAAKDDRPPGEMDRGPARAPDRDQSCARRRMRARDRLRARRNHPGAPRSRPCRRRRLSADQRRHRRAQCRAGVVGALQHSEYPHRRLGACQQQDSGRHVSGTGTI